MVSITKTWVVSVTVMITPVPHMFVYAGSPDGEFAKDSCVLTSHDSRQVHIFLSLLLLSTLFSPISWLVYGGKSVFFYIYLRNVHVK